MSNYNISVKITGDASGFDKALGSAQGKLATFSSKVGSVGANLTKKITLPAVAASTALAGITLVSGFGRLVGIDDAKAKLSALGHDAQSVEEIMNSALESVRGTSYGLDEAATTAANAVAAGIKPGKALTKYLSLTGDAASIAGTSMSEMGSIINRVQTGQVAYTEDLNQLADRGLPIYQWLAKEAGVAASEVKQLASDGKISSEMLLAAIESNIGGAAKIMGDKSFTAALSNIKASIARIGANFLDAGGKGGGFFSQLKPLMVDFREGLEGLEGKAADLGVKFGEAFAGLIEKLKSAKAWYDGLSPTMQNFINKTALIGVVTAVSIGPALQLVGKLTAAFRIMMGFNSKLITLAKNISGVTKSLSGQAIVLNATQLKMQKVALVAQGAFTKSLAGAKGALGGLGLSLRGAGGAMKAFLITAGPLIAIVGALAGLIAYLWKTDESFRKEITKCGEEIKAAFLPIAEQMAGLFADIATALAPVIAQLVEALAPVIIEIAKVISQIVTALGPILVDILKVIAESIKILVPIIAGILKIVAQVIVGIIKIVTPIIVFIGNVITKIIEKVRTIIGAFKTIFGAVKDVVYGVFDRIRDKVVGVFNEIKKAWGKLTDIVIEIKDGIVSAFITLVDKVKGIVNVFIRGINAAIKLINKIPKVNIPKIPQLARGTDNWQGGFAAMNEGGRGELTYLPNGSVVVPHDVSVQYAKESARNNAGVYIDYDALARAVASGVISIGGSLKAGMREAVDGMGMYIDKREIGRVVEVK